MSYAIIRNEKYKLNQLSYLYRHNERKNTNYSNKEIDKNKFIKNYSIKTINTSYQKAFYNIKEKYDLKGQIKKVSNVMCEYVITSDKEFFDTIGVEETKRYFLEAYNFVANYKKLGEEFIVSAKVHMDETTPHMHLVYIPVVHTINKEGKNINKISFSEFWKGKNAYHELQNDFYNYIKEKEFVLERGKNKGTKHVQPEEYKKLINYKEKLRILQLEKIEDIDEKNVKLVVAQNKSLKLYINKIKSQMYDANKLIEKLLAIERNNRDLVEENIKLRHEIDMTKQKIEKLFEYVELMFNFPKERLKKLYEDFNRLFYEK